MENITLLATAIIKEAVYDYRRAYRERYGLIDEETIQRKLDPILYFFRSEWFRELSDIDPEYLIECLQKERIAWLKEKEKEENK